MDKILKWFVCVVLFIGNIALAEEVDAVRGAGDTYLKSYHREMQEDKDQLVDPEKERYVSWWYELLSNNQYNDTEVKSTYRTREVLIQILSVQIQKVTHPVKSSPNILQDSRVLGGEKSGESSMLDVLFPGYTLSGEALKALTLAQPTSNIEVLRHQQYLIKEMMQIPSLHEKLPALLQSLKEYEPTVISLFDKSDFVHSSDVRERVNTNGNPTFQRKIYNTIANGFFKGANHFLSALSGASMVTVALNPFLLDSNYCSCKFLGNAAFSVFSLGFQFLTLGVDYYLKKMREVNEMTLYRSIRVRLDILSYFLREVLELRDLTNLPEELRLEFNGEEMALIESFLNGSEWLMTKDPKAQINYLNYASEILWYSFELKQAIARALYLSGKVDMYQAIARRMNASGNPDDGQLTFVQFKQKPVINARKLWNPVLDPTNVVTNDISLEARDTCLTRDLDWSFIPETCAAGSEPSLRNALLSGCNGSGKSTMMRAITVNSIFLAQVFGIATAESFQTGLFHMIYSHMDKYDQTGEFSSYEGELEQAVQMLVDADALESDQNMLVCFDELFSNTDPEESLYVTNKVLNAMSQKLRTINIVSSHYDVDTYGIDSDNEFARMHMHVEKVNDTLIKTYQLRPGQSKETNGLFYLMEKFRFFPDVYSELKLLMERGDDE